ncbi:MAG: hypothetical protein ACRDGT_11455, partial [Candidatus Limnocylindria bacterium]
AGMRSALKVASAERDALAGYERAFLGYLEGVALREAGSAEDARRAFEAAMEAAPGTIGEALARRERANLLTSLERGKPAEGGATGA